MPKGMYKHRKRKSNARALNYGNSNWKAAARVALKQSKNEKRFTIREIIAKLEMLNQLVG